MNTISKCGVRFFLTGGTALSRAYYNHRYSDDLDFFVNSDPDYEEQLKIIYSRLKDEGFTWDPTKNFISNKNFTSFVVRWDKSDAELKLDFVNDVAFRAGDIIQTGIYYRTDSISNMLSNKITALFRFAAKDVVDIVEIANRNKVNWKQAIADAQNKEAGIDIPIACEILHGMPESEFDTINWIKKPGWESFRSDIDRIVYEMISGETLE